MQVPTPTRARWRLAMGIATAVAALAGCLSDDGDGAEIADAVYRNGHVLTMDASDSEHQAIAIRGGRILLVGTNEEVGRHIGAGTEVVDLAGRTLMPGIVDGHNHVVLGGENQELCNLGAQVFTAESEAMNIIQGCLDDPKYAASNNWLGGAWLVAPAGHQCRPDEERPGQSDHHPPHQGGFGRLPQNLVTAKPSNSLASPRTRRSPRAGESGSTRPGIRMVYWKTCSPWNCSTPEAPSDGSGTGAVAKVGLKAMGEQGITSFLNPLSTDAYMTTFRSLQAKGELTARASFAIECVRPKESTRTRPSRPSRHARPSSTRGR